MRFLEVPGLGQVSRVGLGTWQFGSREWGYGAGYATGAAVEIVERARELGVTLFDTAEVYGFGKSERILARALGADRDRVVVASKVFPVAPFPAVVRRREQASARRLQLERIPLYQVHQPNPVVPDSVIMAGMRSLLRDGRIGAVGVSNYSLRRWHRADDALGQPVVSNQVQFSLAHSDPLEDLVPFAERENRVVIAYSPLAQGLLGGKYTVDNRPGGVRAANPLFGTENLRRVAPLLNTLRQVADAYDVKPAQVALAWLLSQPPGRCYSRRVQCRAARVQRRRCGPRTRWVVPGDAHRSGEGLHSDLSGPHHHRRTKGKVRNLDIPISRRPRRAWEAHCHGPLGTSG
jgi:aryl-alcohol dehydrogenase-like predicted oxidoreductase